MKRMTNVSIAMIGLVLLGSGTLFAQSETDKQSETASYAYVMDGKKVTRKIVPKAETGTVDLRGAVPDPDAYEYRTVGKRVERVMLKDLPPPPPREVVSDPESYAYFPVGKRTERRSFSTTTGKNMQ
jgi:hypothetical protein